MRLRFMSFVEDCRRLGPPENIHQTGLLTAYIVLGEPFSIIKAGLPAIEEIDAAQQERRQARVSEDVPCFRVVELDNFICEQLSGESQIAFQHGSAVSWHPKANDPERSDIETLVRFFEMLMSDDRETALLPRIASFLSTILVEGQFSPIVDIRLGSVLRAFKRLNCNQKLRDCIDHVLQTGHALLLWYVSDDDGETEPRLIAHTVDHWMVPRPMPS